MALKLEILKSKKYKGSDHTQEKNKVDLKKNKKLADFYAKEDLEQATILLQNITVSKKNFNFSIFKTSKSRKKGGLLSDGLTEAEIQEDRLQKQREQEERNNINWSDPIFKEYDLNFEGANTMLGDSDYYRDIIREKMVKESDYKNEYVIINFIIRLMRMSQSLCEKKIEKQRLNAENIILSSELAKKRENFMLKKGWLEHQKQHYEKMYTNLIQQNSSGSTFKEYTSEASMVNSKSTLMKDLKEKDNARNKTEELMALKNDFSIKIALKEKELKEHDERFQSYKKKVIEKLDYNKKLLEDLAQEWTYMKNIFNQLIKDQKYYYLEMLKKGIDTR